MTVLHGTLELARFDLTNYGLHPFKEPLRLQAGQQAAFKVPRNRP